MSLGLPPLPPIHEGPSWVRLGLGVALGIMVTVAALWAFGWIPPATTPFGGSSTSHSASCPSNAADSLGNSTAGGPATAGAPANVNAHAWAESSSNVTVTAPVDISPGSLILVFVGYVGWSIGGPESVTLCDSAGDAFFAQATTNYVSNHTEQLFVAFDAVGGSAVQFAAQFTDTDASAGGNLAVVDIVGAAELTAHDLLTSADSGVSNTSVVNFTATAPSLLVVGVTGQGKIGPVQPLSPQSLLDTYGYYDVGPWGDGEAFGSMAGASTSEGAVSYSTVLAAGGVWDAIGVLVS